LSLIRQNAAGIKLPSRRFDVATPDMPSETGKPNRGMWAGAMKLKWIGPLGLLAALVIGDQIRINRPGHKISHDG
jgi:hypothetical protein